MIKGLKNAKRPISV